LETIKNTNDVFEVRNFSISIAVTPPTESYEPFMYRVGRGWAAAPNPTFLARTVGAQRVSEPS